MSKPNSEYGWFGLRYVEIKTGRIVEEIYASMDGVYWWDGEPYISAENAKRAVEEAYRDL